MSNRTVISEMKPGFVGFLTAFLVIVFFIFSADGSAAGESAADKRSWKTIKGDNLHDPEGPGADLLQNPVDALRALPADKPGTGNQVRWVEALRSGQINPRTNIFPETKIEILDLDIIMGNTGEMPLVLFPHRHHTEWLDCENCHDKIFVPKVDANPINMYAVLMGEYCGRCHGAVAFPLTECQRCHSVRRSEFKGKLGAQK